MWFYNMFQGAQRAFLSFFRLFFLISADFLIYFHFGWFLLANFRKSLWGIVFFYLRQHIFSIPMRKFDFVLFTMLSWLIYSDFWNGVWNKWNLGTPRIDQQYFLHEFVKISGVFLWGTIASHLLSAE